jgi:dihydroorotase
VQALARVTSAPAAALGCPGGSLAAGAPADVCVFDPDAHWTVSAATLSSQGRNTPFLGLEVSGRVRQTLVGGRVVFEG